MNSLMRLGIPLVIGGWMAIASAADSDFSFFTEKDPEVPASARIAQLSDSGKKDQALKAAEAALKENDKNAQVKFQRAVLLGELGRKAESKAAFEQLIREYPELSEPYNNLAVMYAAEGNLGTARELLEKALNNDAKSALTYRNLGNIYLALARNAFIQAEDNSPNNKTLQNQIRTIDGLLGNRLSSRPQVKSVAKEK